MEFGVVSGDLAPGENDLSSFAAEQGTTVEGDDPGPRLSTVQHRDGRRGV
jgi:hypothetical protein